MNCQVCGKPIIRRAQTYIPRPGILPVSVWRHEKGLDAHDAVPETEGEKA